jgi:hypothetical protein
MELTAALTKQYMDGEQKLALVEHGEVAVALQAYCSTLMKRVLLEHL